MKAVILTDGPHLLSPPTVRVFMRLQQLGFPVVEQFAWQSLTRETGRVVDDEPEREFDIEALAKHLLAMLEVAEPSKWTLDTVADAMVFDNLGDYLKTLVELFNASFDGDDPKADAS